MKTSTKTCSSLKPWLMTTANTRGTVSFPKNPIYLHSSRCSHTFKHYSLFAKSQVKLTGLICSTKHYSAPSRRASAVQAVAERQREYSSNEYDIPPDRYSDDYSQSPRRDAYGSSSQQQNSLRKYSQPEITKQAEEVLLSRSQLINKAVITRTSGSNLGVVSQLWVDTDEWRLISLDLRENLLFGDLQCVLLDSVRQVGDVILVHSERAVEMDNSVYGLLPLMGSEVLTEAGEFLGRVRDFTFDPETGKLARIIFDAFGVPLVPDTVVSCYALSIEEVVSAGPSRILVREGAEAAVQQLTSSLLQRIALSEAPWEESIRYGYYNDYDYDNDYQQNYFPSDSRDRQDYDYNYYQEEERSYQPRGEQRDTSQDGEKVAKVRLYGPRKRVPTNQRLDFDGKLGDLTDEISQQPEEEEDARTLRQSRTFDDWLQKEEREYVPAGMTARQESRSSASQSFQMEFLQNQASQASEPDTTSRQRAPINLDRSSDAYDDPRPSRKYKLDVRVDGENNRNERRSGFPTEPMQSTYDRSSISDDDFGSGWSRSKARENRDSGW